MPVLKWKDPTEAEIESAIIDMLNMQPGCYAFKHHVKGTWNEKGKFFQKPGKHVPIGGADILFCFRGLFGCFEVKTPAAYKRFLKSPGDHELRQQSFLARVRNKGGLAEVVCSVEQAEAYVKRWLKSDKPFL